MARSAGIPGLGVAMATAGGFLLYCGINDVGLIDGLRAIVSGHLPTPGAQHKTVVTWGRNLGSATPSGGAGTVTASSSSSALVTAARKYLGVPYRIDGATPAGFDCSGLVNWVACHDVGLPIPGYAGGTFTGSSHGPNTTSWYAWSGLSDVGRQDLAPGDLVCWTGHIGIVSQGGSTPMFIAAPTLGRTVTEEAIYWTPAPRIRRYPASSGSVTV